MHGTLLNPPDLSMGKSEMSKRYHIGTPTTVEVKDRNGEVRNSWVVSYKDNLGKPRRLYAKTKDDLKEKIEELEEKLKAGVYNANKINFQKAGLEALEARAELIGKKNGLRQQTWGNDERHYRLHLEPYFSEMQMRNMTVGDVNQFIEQMKINEIAPKTQRHIIGTLTVICKHCVSRGYMATNPCAKGDREQVRGSMGKRSAYTADEVQRMFSQDVVLSVRALMQTSAFTGLAANELQGLRWPDIDLYAGMITVSNTGYRNALQDETKTEYRQRTVPIPSSLLKLLREWKVNCHSDTWVFPSIKGGMGEQNAWRKQILNVCKMAGVDDKGLGGFRKFYHSQMEVDGVPKSIRNYRMGHSQASKTADIHYTDADIKAAQSAADIETIAARVSA